MSLLYYAELGLVDYNDLTLQDDYNDLLLQPAWGGDLTMYLKYGDYQHANGECSLIISRQAIFNRHGVEIATRERWDVHGRLQADTPALVDAAIAELEAAYSSHGRNIALYTDSGTITSHAMTSADANGGTRVVIPPSYPEGRGAEFSTFRNYVLAVEAEFSSSEGGLLSWTETINFRGTGGPVWHYQLPLNGRPIEQLLRQRSTAWVYQQGQAIGLRVYPVVPAPLWPQNEHQELRDIRYLLPADNSGQRIVTWAYAFETPDPTFARPRARAINR